MREHDRYNFFDPVTEREAILQYRQNLRAVFEDISTIKDVLLEQNGRLTALEKVQNQQIGALRTVVVTVPIVSVAVTGSGLVLNALKVFG